MVKMRKYIITITLASMTTWIASAGMLEVPKNQDIRLEYQTMARQLREIISQNLTSKSAFIPFGKGHRAIKLAGCLRCSEVREILLDNLGYTPWAATSKNSGAAFTNFNFFAAVTGERLSLTGRYPAVLALLRIGIPYASFASRTGLYVGYESEDALSLIGRSCGGGYYFYVYNSKNSGEKPSSIQPSRINLILPEHVYEIKQCDGIGTEHGYIDYEQKYIALQTILLSRFDEEKATSSADLADTIRAMGHIRSLKAVPLLTENLTICPQVSTNAPGGYMLPAAEALIEIGPAIGYCFGQLEKTAPLSVEELLWLRISHELYPEGLEYDLMRRAETNDTRAARLLGALPWRRLDANYDIINSD